MPIVADAAVAVRADMSKFNSDVKSGAAKGSKSFGDKLKSVLNPTNVAGGLAGAFLGSQVVGFLNDTAAAASDLEEAQSKVNVVFAESSDQVTEWSEDSASGFLMSKRAALEAAGTYGNLFQAFGVARPAATEMSQTLVELAADLASFNNTEVDEALEAIRSGLSGEAEPLKRYGVAMNEARLQEVAMTEGIWDGVGALDAGQKAQAAYALILQDTALAQGDVARTGDGLANSQREMAAKIENAEAEIGKAWASIQLGAIKTVEFLTQDISLAPIAMDFGEQADRIHGLADGIGISFDTMKNRIRDKMAETGMTFEQATNAIERHWKGLDESMRQSTDQIVAEAIGGLQDGTPAIVDAATAALADPLVVAMLGGQEEAERIASETPGSIAQALIDNQFSVEDAAASLAQAEADGLLPMVERSQIIAFLASSELAEGLASGVPAVAARARELRDAATARLAELSGDAFYWGLNSAQSYADGLNAGYGYVVTAAGNLAAATRNQIGINSEPEDHNSPLYGITKWGGNIVKTLAGGIYGELGTGSQAAHALAGALVPSFAGGSLSTGRAASPGMAGAGNTYNVHLEDKLEARTVTDIGRALRRLGEAGLLPGSLTDK